MNDFMDGKIFEGAAPAVTPTEPKVKEPNEGKKSRQVGNTFITIGQPGVAPEAPRKATGKQKQAGGKPADTDDSDDSEEVEEK